MHTRRNGQRSLSPIRSETGGCSLPLFAVSTDGEYRSSYPRPAIHQRLQPVAMHPRREIHEARGAQFESADAPSSAPSVTSHRTETRSSPIYQLVCSSDDQVVNPAIGCCAWSLQGAFWSRAIG